MKQVLRKKYFSLILAVILALFLFPLEGRAGSAPEVWLEQPTGFTKAQDVVYVSDGGYIANWGVRGENAVFLSEYAESYYTGNYTFEQLGASRGESDIAAVPLCPMFKALSLMMNEKSEYVTTYADTRDLYKYTDCMVSDYLHISSFYSGAKLNGAWDKGTTWNREHVWPNSKIDGDGENDIMMLRPTWVSENSDRGNMAFGESAGCYDPNTVSDGLFNLRGDCARVLLYTYVRWGTADTMWGSEGVIESPDLLLEWMEEDPVDTWEMGRNDAVESITGVRNVFVDYPEFAWLLFGQEVPGDYVTPSSPAESCPHNYVAAVTEPTCTTSGFTTWTCTLCGKSFLSDTVPALGHVDSDHDRICDDCGANLGDFLLHTEELEEGDYLIVSEGKALRASSESSPKRLDYAEVTEGDAIDCEDPALIFHIAPEGDHWTILNEEAALFAGGDTTKNQAAMIEGGTDFSLWTAAREDGAFEFVNKGKEEAGVNANLRCNGTYGWACYSTGTGKSLTLYKKFTPPPEVESVTLNRTKVSAKVGLTVQLAASCAPADARDTSVTWESSCPEVAVVSDDGLVKAVRCGTATITARAVTGAEATCKVTVKQKYVWQAEKNGVYRYTANKTTLQKLKDAGWTCKKVFRAAGKSETPVYWIYNKTAKRFRYTADRYLALAAKKAGNKAGRAFYGSDSRAIPVYELSLKSDGPAWFYTTSRTLSRNMQKLGWSFNGIAWYAEQKNFN